MRAHDWHMCSLVVYGGAYNSYGTFNVSNSFSKLGITSHGFTLDTGHTQFMWSCSVNIIIFGKIVYNVIFGKYLNKINE